MKSNGGILGTFSTTGNTITISECYVTGNISGTGAGLICRTEASGSAVAVINNCYVLGNVTTSSGSPFIGSLDNATITVNNCYYSGTLHSSAGYGVYVRSSGSITYNDCVFNKGSSPISSIAVGGSITQNRSSYTIGDVEDGSLPSAWSTSIWSAVSGAGKYAILDQFTNTDIWQAGYTEHDDLPALNTNNLVFYSTSTAVYTVGSAITNNIPIIGIDDTLSFSSSPSLPTGLSIDGSTGIISGTPLATTAEVTYTITYRTVPSSLSTTITITVVLPAPDITASSSSATLTENSVMTPITITNTGGTATFTISPTLPTGLSINSSTGTISGTPHQLLHLLIIL